MGAQGRSGWIGGGHIYFLQRGRAQMWGLAVGQPQQRRGGRSRGRCPSDPPALQDWEHWGRTGALAALLPPRGDTGTPPGLLWGGGPSLGVPSPPGGAQQQLVLHRHSSVTGCLPPPSSSWSLSQQRWGHRGVGEMGHEPPKGTGPPQREDTSPRGQGTPGNGDTPIARPRHSPPRCGGARSPKAPVPPPSPCRGGPGAAHLPPQTAERPRAAQPVAGGHCVVGELWGKEDGGLGGASPGPPPTALHPPIEPPRRSQHWDRAHGPWGPRGWGTPLLGDPPPKAGTPFTSRFLRALNVRRFSRWRRNGCGSAPAAGARTRRCHRVPILGGLAPTTHRPADLDPGVHHTLGRCHAVPAAQGVWGAAGVPAPHTRRGDRDGTRGDGTETEVKVRRGTGWRWR